MAKKIKSVLVSKFDYYFQGPDNEALEQDGVKNTYTEYNKNGLIIKDSKYDLNGLLLDRTEKKFDDANKLIEEMLFDENDELVERWTYERDEKGRISREFQHYLDSSFDTTNYVYDDLGHLIEKNKVDSDGDSDGREVFEFKDGKKVSEETYDENNELIAKNTFLFNDHGHLIEIGNWNPDEGSNIKILNTFDEKGNIEKILKYNDEGHLLEKSIYEMDEKANVVKIIEEDRHQKVEILFKYDTNENVIEQLVLNDAGEINQKISRKFDDDNNVVESEVEINGHGVDMSQHYLMKYEYQNFDQENQ